MGSSCSKSVCFRFFACLCKESHAVIGLLSRFATLGYLDKKCHALVCSRDMYTSLLHTIQPFAMGLRQSKHVRWADEVPQDYTRAYADQGSVPQVVTPFPCSSSSKDYVSDCLVGHSLHSGYTTWTTSPLVPVSCFTTLNPRLNKPFPCLFPSTPHIRLDERYTRLKPFGFPNPGHGFCNMSDRGVKGLNVGMSKVSRKV